jgi:STE24 endopeptidase
MKIFILFCYLLVIAAECLLQALNLRHLRRLGNEVPPDFALSVNAEALARANAYTLELSRLGLAEALVDALVLILFLFGGGLRWYDRWISALGGSFVLSGILFFAGLTVVQTVIAIPFDTYRTFRLENRYGFNTTTPRLWAADLLKSTGLSLGLLALVGGGGLCLVQFSPRLWWFWVWCFVALVSLFLIYLSPYVIEPLFSRFEPVREPGLEEEIRALLARAGLRVDRVLQVDASRRSRHSNAYFTGIGRVKRIVLYDTLLAQMEHGEILAILAHEVGHWRKGHVWKRLLATELGALAATWCAWRLITAGWLPGSIGLDGASFAAQVLILGVLSTLVTFPFTPLGSWLSRRQELQADDCAAALTGAPDALASALVKLSAENLANLHPHPFYAWFYYSHPPVVDRIARLKGGEPKPH